MKKDIKNTVMLLVAIIAIAALAAFFVTFAEGKFENVEGVTSEESSTSDPYECEHDIDMETCLCHICGNYYHNFTDAYEGCGPESYYSCVRCGEISNILVPHVDPDKDGICNYCGHDLTR